MRKWIGKQIKKCNINIVWMREHIRSVEGREMKRYKGKEMGKQNYEKRGERDN